MQYENSDNFITKSHLNSPLVKKLGVGTGVSVYKVTRYTPKGRHFASPWALKKVTTQSREAKLVIARLHKEAQILQKLDHENIVKFKGTVLKPKPGLNLEYGGVALSKMLEKCDEDLAKPLDTNIAKNIVLAVTKALKYLHNEALILHGDIKSDNVLYNESTSIAKLCDFGVSLELMKDDESDFMILKNPGDSYVGSNLFRPIESLNVPMKQNHSKITDRCDIWCFGLLIFEMLTLSPPYLPQLDCAQEENETFNDSYDESNFDRKLDLLIGTRPILPGNIDDNCPADLLELFYVCTEEDYTKRPSSEQIYNALVSD